MAAPAQRLLPGTAPFKPFSLAPVKAGQVTGTSPVKVPNQAMPAKAKPLCIRPKTGRGTGLFKAHTAAIGTKRTAADRPTTRKTPGEDALPGRSTSSSEGSPTGTPKGNAQDSPEGSLKGSQSGTKAPGISSSEDRKLLPSTHPSRRNAQHEIGPTGRETAGSNSPNSRSAQGEGSPAWQDAQQACSPKAINTTQQSCLTGSALEHDYSPIAQQAKHDSTLKHKDLGHGDLQATYAAEQGSIRQHRSMPISKPTVIMGTHVGKGTSTAQALCQDSSLGKASSADPPSGNVPSPDRSLDKACGQSVQPGKGVGQELPSDKGAGQELPSGRGAGQELPSGRGVAKSCCQARGLAKSSHQARELAKSSHQARHSIRVFRQSELQIAVPCRSQRTYGSQNPPWSQPLYRHRPHSELFSRQQNQT